MLVERIEGLPNLGRCETCGAAIIVYPSPTPKRYCDSSCRNKGKIKRRAELADNQTEVSSSEK